MTPFFLKKSLNNQISNILDVGFHPYGPTLNLGGTLSTEKKIFLIDHISLTTQLPSQSDYKTFDWFTLQPNSTLENQFQIVNSPSKFVLSPGKPYNYFIMFVDNDRYAEMKTVVLNILSSWQGMKEHDRSNKPTEELYQDFCNTAMTQELNDMLRRICYWKKGSYDIDICITSKDDTFVTKKRFELNDEDIENLKSNSLNIISSACGWPTGQYNIVKVDMINR